MKAKMKVKFKAKMKVKGVDDMNRRHHKPNRKPKHESYEDYHIERDHKHNHQNEQKFRNLLNTKDIDAILAYEDQL